MELKPCPFCGNDPEFDFNCDSTGIFCKACGCCSDTGDEKRIVSEWNHRPIEDELQAENTILDKAMTAVNNEGVKLRRENIRLQAELEQVKSEKQHLAGQYAKLRTEQADQSAENTKLKQVITDYGNGTDFDWDCLKKETEQEDEIKRLREVLTKIKDRYKNIPGSYVAMLCEQSLKGAE